MNECLSELKTDFLDSMYFAVNQNTSMIFRLKIYNNKSNSSSCLIIEKLQSNLLWSVITIWIILTLKTVF